MKKVSIIVVLVVIMAVVFFGNIFVLDDANRVWFKTFQKDSESLVIAKIVKDKYNINDNKYGLQNAYDISYDGLIDLLNNKNDNDIHTKDYISQIGIQGIIFSFLYNKLHIPVTALNILCALILAIVLVTICYLLKKKYGALFAGTFYIVFLLSPWIVSFARNLYWVPFTWFLPLMFVLLLNKTNNKKIFLPLIFLSVFLKSLCGYEYLSTILLSAISFLIVDFFLEKGHRKKILKDIFVIGIICVLGFLSAILIHALIRGDGNILSGVKSIIERDVLRRTMCNNSDLFENQLIKDSINASYMSVIKMYCRFSTDIILGVNGNLFIELSFFAFIICIWGVTQKQENSKRDLTMYIIFAIVTLSWLILGKAHSYIHTHMNYVLWYFGFVQITFYIIIKFIIRKIKECDLNKL